MKWLFEGNGTLKGLQGNIYETNCFLTIAVVLQGGGELPVRRPGRQPAPPGRPGRQQEGGRHAPGGGGEVGRGEKVILVKPGLSASTPLTPRAGRPYTWPPTPGGMSVDQLGLVQ